MLRKFLFIAAIALPFYSANAECINLGSNTCVAATSYEIEIEKVEFCKSVSCSSPYVVSSTSADFDISSASAGGAVGNYANLDSVPAGVYTHVRTTIDGTITYSAPATGSCSQQIDTPYDVTTIPNIAVALGANPDFNLSLPGGGNLLHRYELSTPLTITKAGSLPQIQIDFSTADGHICDGSNSYPGVPYVDIRIFNN